MYSNYFEIVSTVIFLIDCLTKLISDTFLFKTVVPYSYKYYIMIIQSIVFATSGF